MTCREIVGFLDGYRAGELDRAARKRFDAHLAICPDCVGYLRSYEATIRLAAASGDDEPCPPAPRSLVEAILDALDDG